MKHVNALTSLLALQDGSVLVGVTNTGSANPVLLRLESHGDVVRDTGVRFPAKGLPGTFPCSIGDKIHNALVAGTGPWAGWILFGHGSHVWWNEGGWPFAPDVFPGGGIYAWEPSTGKTMCLGIPVQNNTVHGLYGGDGFAVGYSLPDNHFFSVDYASGEMIDWGRISAYCCHSFVCHGTRAYGVFRRSLGEQRGDVVVTSDVAAFLLVYDHATSRLERTDILISELNTNIRFNSGMDTWLSTGHGVLGGRVNGTLFLLDPDTLAITELGHAVEPNYPLLTDAQIRQFGGRQCHGIHGAERVTSLAMMGTDRVIGCAGFPNMRVFMLDLVTRQRIDLGPVNTNRPMCYFHDLALVAKADGGWEAVVAETDSECANLYLLDINNIAWP